MFDGTTPATVSALNLDLGAPKPLPPVLTAPTQSAAGGVVINIQAPAAGAAVPVAFYRLYRGASDYKSRIDRTGDGTTLRFVDNERTFGAGTQYWVTAVSNDLTESTPVQVTG